MLQSLKDKWLNALRSGNYGQCTGRLRESDANGNGFCCLGVLADVHSPSTWDCLDYDDEDVEGNSHTVEEWHHGESEELLDELYAEEVGLAGSEQSILAKLNDDGQSFEAIADYIEENIYGYGPRD